MSMVHASRGTLQPASEHLRSEPAIIAGLARATLPASRVNWQELVADYDRIRDAIEGVFPDFRDFNERIRHPGGFRLPLPPTERRWPTASGKAQFIPWASARAHADAENWAVGENGADGASRTFALTTFRSHDQYNTTIYDLGDRYRGVFGRRDVVFMNKIDLEELGIAHGDLIDMETALPLAAPLRLRGMTAVEYDISRGSIATYYPEANCLVPLNYHDPASGTPSYKSVPVKISAATADASSNG